MKLNAMIRIPTWNGNGDDRVKDMDGLKWSEIRWPALRSSVLNKMCCQLANILQNLFKCNTATTKHTHTHTLTHTHTNNGNVNQAMVHSKSKNDWKMHLTVDVRAVKAKIKCITRLPPHKFKIKIHNKSNQATANAYPANKRQPGYDPRKKKTKSFTKIYVLQPRQPRHNS